MHPIPTTPSAGTAATLLALALGACGQSPRTPEDMNASYEEALTRTAAQAVEYAPGEERAALASAAGFFDDMNENEVRHEALAAYAPRAYLNDTMAVVEGAPAIADYFTRTLQRTNSLTVEFLDVAHDGIDYFVRWRMTVVSSSLNDRAPMVSYGMSHFRFDAQGRILLHKDFWDTGTGLYEYLPVIGSALRRVRAMAEGDG